MYNKESKTIVVLGMHRSGTSMLSGVLSRLGINMGDELLGKDASNPLGHFEDREFLDLNKRILEAAGGSWDNPPSQEEILLKKKQFEKEIKELITKAESRSILWGWKEPRTSITIDLYLSYLDNPYFIFCHRDPMAVARSLNRRNNMEIDEGLNLREIYEERVNNFFYENPDLKRLDVYYEKILLNPEVWINKISDFIDLEVSNEDFQKAIEIILPREEVNKLSRKVAALQLFKKLIKKFLGFLKLISK
jgi:hypothetical protein